MPKEGKRKLFIEGEYKIFDLSNEKDRSGLRGNIGGKYLRMIPAGEDGIPIISRPTYLEMVQSWDKRTPLTEFHFNVLAKMFGRNIEIVNGDAIEQIGHELNDPNKPPIRMKLENGHYMPMIQSGETGEWKTFTDIPNMENSCGVESILTVLEYEKLSKSSHSIEAEAAARSLFADDSKGDLRTAMYDGMKLFALTSPELQDLYLGRSHENGIVGGTSTGFPPQIHVFESVSLLRADMANTLIRLNPETLVDDVINCHVHERDEATKKMKRLLIAFTQTVKLPIEVLEAITISEKAQYQNDLGIKTEIPKVESNRKYNTSNVNGYHSLPENATLGDCSHLDSAHTCGVHINVTAAFEFLQANENRLSSSQLREARGILQTIIYEQGRVDFIPKGNNIGPDRDYDRNQVAELQKFWVSIKRYTECIR
jgi:hypothetical protein